MSRSGSSTRRSPTSRRRSGLPDDARYLARSWAFLGKGETNRAMTDAEEALRLEPTLAEAHLIRSEILHGVVSPSRPGLRVRKRWPFCSAVAWIRS